MPRLTWQLGFLLFAVSACSYNTVVEPDSVDPEEIEFDRKATIQSNYEKHSYRIPMRDGVFLYTQVYSPKDQSKSYPILLNRTPYRPFFHPTEADDVFEFLGPGPEFAEEGYIFVYQDVRGRFLSEGDFVVMRPNTADWSDNEQSDESTDAYDTIEWLIQNVENSNGKVGVFGVSYPGTYAALALVNAHPAVRVALIEAPISSTFLSDDYHHNGAMQLLYPFMWLNNIGLAERNGPSEVIPPPICSGFEKNFYEYFLEMGVLSNMNKNCFGGQIEFWNDLMAHENYDEFHQSRGLSQYLKGIKDVKVLVVGSWFDDQDLYGSLDVYRAIEAQNPTASVNLVMGPWNHAKWWDQKKEPWGDVGIPVKETGAYYRKEIVAAFFRSHLKGEGDFRLPEATVFESGSNQWREYSEWPALKTVAEKLFLSPGQSLSGEPHLASDEFDQFTSDPNDPVPQIPADEMYGWTAEVMIRDQRFAAARDDVLYYQGTTLEEDTSVSGPIDIELFVSTTGTDADWVVKLIDVYPEDDPDLPGFQMLVRGDILRGKFRTSFENPEPFEPDVVTPIRFGLVDTNHTFRKGHRMMVQVQSTWFPMFDRNPQKFISIRNAVAGDYQVADHRVYFSEKHPSGITIRVVH